MRLKLKHPAAPSTTALFLSISLVAGCAAGGSIEEPVVAVSAPEPIVIEFGEPAQQKLALIGPEGRVRVGDPYESGLDAFPRPDKAPSIEELPAGVNGDFRARGWEQGGSTFGMLTQDGLVALAMRTRARVDAELVRETFAEYQRPDIEPRRVVRGPISYWFWHDGDTRFMFVEARDKEGNLILTEAVGHIEVMDRLRMSPGLARSDASQANRILNPPQS